MKKVKVGIIGAGGISGAHTAGYQKLGNVEIYAVCDINENRAKQYAERNNVPHVFTDYNEMLKLEELDAVSVTTWNNGHAPISIAALKAGKHVLCEKPLAMNAEEAEEMVRVAEETGKLLMVGFVRRFEDNANYLKEIVERGDLGDILYAKTGYIRKYGNPGGWFSDSKRSGGGPVIDLGVHVIDLVRYICGLPKAVSVSASIFNNANINKNIKTGIDYVSADFDPAKQFSDVEDAAAAIIKFDNGMTLFFETSWVLNVKENKNYLDIYGNKAGVQMEPNLEIYEMRDGYFAESKPSIGGFNGFSQIFIKEIAHFIDCITKGVPCRNPAKDGLEVMRIIDAIYESAKTGHEVIIRQS